MVMSTASRPDPQIMSFLAVRRALGLLGLFLPISLYVYARPFGNGMQPSISEFYHSDMGGVVVGVLIAIGIFLISYKGYPRQPKERGVSDQLVATIAGIAVIGVALFPVEPPHLECSTQNLSLDTQAFSHGITVHWCNFAWIHFLFAAIFFVCLTVFCFFLFPRGDRTCDERINWKAPVNRLYLICGIGLTLSLFSLFVYALVGDESRMLLRNLNYVYWWETAGVFCFAVSWLVKGQVLRGIKNLAF